MKIENGEKKKIRKRAKKKMNQKKNSKFAKSYERKEIQKISWVHLTGKLEQENSSKYFE